jgi:hypothetical protein
MMENSKLVIECRDECGDECRDNLTVVKKTPIHDHLQLSAQSLPFAIERSPRFPEIICLSQVPLSIV